MFKRMHLVAAAAVCGLTMGLLPLPAAHAANTVVTAQVSGDPFIVGWVDTSQGIGTDKNLEKSMHDLFAGATFAFQDDNSLTVTGQNGKTIFRAAYVGDPTKIATFHIGGKVIINGDFGATSNDGTKAFSVMWVSFPTSDGKGLESPRIQLNLTAGGGTTPPSTGPFGN